MVQRTLARVSSPLAAKDFKAKALLGVSVTDDVANAGRLATVAARASTRTVRGRSRRCHLRFIEDITSCSGVGAEFGEVGCNRRADVCGLVTRIFVA